MKITHCKLNHLKNPLGYQLTHTTFSWHTELAAGSYQTQARIVVFQDGKFDEVIFDTGFSNLNSLGTTLKLPLQPRTRYLWQVTVQTDGGEEEKSNFNEFETGKMEESWVADWIAAPQEDGCHPYMEKTVNIKHGLRSARLYATGVGLFEAYINGEKLGDEYLKPGLTDYETRIQVITFQVENLHEGENQLSFLLGKGWYMGIFGLKNDKNNYGSRMAVIAELHLDYADGTHEIIGTDSGFRYCASQIEDSGIYFGETINRQKSYGEWKQVQTLSSSNLEDSYINLKKLHLCDRLSPPIRIQEKISVKEIIHTPAGETVLDFGQNLAGFPEFDAELPAGTTVQIDFGEILQQGNFYNKNYRDARSRLEYTSNGSYETVRPSFTYFGFRYLRISGWPGKLSKETFRACVLHSDMERVGYLQTGNEKLNRLYQNVLWGLKSNFIDIPTDCPQRSERLGWTGDAQIFASTACYYMDTAAFYQKFIRDLMDEQSVLKGAVPNFFPNMGHNVDATSAWGDIATILPDTLWRVYGDRELLAYCYPMMKAWVDYMDHEDVKREFTFTPDFQFGDWLALDGATPTSFKGATDDCYLGAAYYYHSANLTAKAATVLGYEEDAAHYQTLSEEIRQAFLREYFTPNGRLAMDTQASYVVALKFGLWIDRERLVAQFQERLKKDGYKIRCGFVGAPMICTVLAENGLTDLAYDFLLNETFPSWLYCVNLGATTVWERWNSVASDGTISDTGMNSLNHYAYGSVMEFLYAYGAGLRPREPGWRSAVIAPCLTPRLGFVEASYSSVAGKYVCNIYLREDGSVDAHIEIPFGCSAEIHLPGYSEILTEHQTGKYDFHYIPEHDLRKCYDADTPLRVLSNDAQAMDILKHYIPPIAKIAIDDNSEFINDGLADFRGRSFLPIEPENLEQAIQKIQEVVMVVNY